MVEQRSPKPWVVGSNPARPVKIKNKMNLPLSWGQIAEIVLLVIAAGLTFRYRNEIKKFIAEVASELKKVSWTTRKDLIDSTWVVLASSVALGLFIGIIDFFLSRVMALFMK